jgi:hypothetical protein
MDYTILLRRDTAFDWLDQNPVLKEGEPGYETDTKRLKIGNGILTWSALPYFAGDVGSVEGLAEHIASLTPHPVYDDGPSLALLYQNAKV